VTLVALQHFPAVLDFPRRMSSGIPLRPSPS
jgi:hypothetical protein